jgi:hypothetical protein
MSLRVALPLLVAGALPACVSTPARVLVPGPQTAQAEVTQHRGRTCVTVGERADGCWDGVSLDGFAFSADGRFLAYPARTGNTWSMVHDGRAGAQWLGVGAPVLSADGHRLAYPAWDGRSWQVMVDGAAEPAFDAVLAGSLVFDPPGRRHAYAARRADSVHVIVDGSVGAGWDAVTRIAFSPSGEDVAWAGRRGGAAMFVINGTAGPAHNEISELVLDEGRYAYAARDGAMWRVLHGAVGPQENGGGAYGPYDRVAYLAIRGAVWFVAASGDRRAVVRDGAAHGWHEEVSAPVLGTAGDAWAYVASDGDASAVIVAGRVVGRWPFVGDLAIAADGGRHAFVAADTAGTEYVVDDRGAYAFERVIPETLHFSACGYWATLVLPAGRGGDLHVVVDGVVTETRLEWAAFVRLLRRPDPARALRDWVSSAAARSHAAMVCL